MPICQSVGLLGMRSTMRITESVKRNSLLESHLPALTTANLVRMGQVKAEKSDQPGPRLPGLGTGQERYQLMDELKLGHAAQRKMIHEK
ncbi:unnamed protein product [Protopolystoma xenopodis]|uniref:Uncharacterized protein n=1 Tax=Protopolystoma xenopodis TaxID=117903 RepID=A0A3S5BHS1_9PLAT|nr:unnamed protein product [Protopolystoma xenopodis]